MIVRSNDGEICDAMIGQRVGAISDTMLQCIPSCINTPVGREMGGPFDLCPRARGVATMGRA